jgi:hypothetical protein
MRRHSGTPKRSGGSPSFTGLLAWRLPLTTTTSSLAGLGRHVGGRDFLFPPCYFPCSGPVISDRSAGFTGLSGAFAFRAPPFTGIYRRARTPAVESWGLVPAIHAFDSIANNVRTPRDLGSARGPQNPLPLCEGLWNVSASDRCAMPTGTIARPAAGVCGRVSRRQSCHHGKLAGKP